MAQIILRNLKLVVFEDELLSRSQSGTIWGRIYFDLGGEFFPEKGWSDMAVVVADAWLNRLIQVGGAGIKTARFCFMDGPFYVTITFSGPGLVQVGFLHKTALKHSALVSFDDVLKDAVSAGGTLISVCQGHHWTDGPDYHRLVSTVGRAIKLLTEIGNGKPGTEPGD